MARQKRTGEQKVVCAPRISRKNQITIPVSVLKQLNLRPGDHIRFIEESDGSIRLVPQRYVPDFSRLVGAVPMIYDASGEILDDLRGEVDGD